MKPHNFRNLPIILALLFLATPTLAQTDHAAAISQLKAFRPGGSDAVFGEIDQWVNQSRSDPQRRQEAARDLAGVLQSDASFDAKEFACRELIIVGTEDQVPALTGLLTDEALAHYALMALARIPGPKVNDALLAALPHATGRTQLEIMDTLGERQVPAAVPLLTTGLQSTDLAVVDAAATALAKINSAPAVAALRQAYGPAAGARRLTLGRALLRSADGLQASGRSGLAIYNLLGEKDGPPELKAAALRGMMQANVAGSLPRLLDALREDDTPVQRMAVSLIRGMDSPAVSRSLAAGLPGLSTTGKLLALSILSDRGDAAASPAVAALTRSPESSVRAAAINTLGAIGNSSALPPLLDLASTGSTDDRTLALASLSRLRGAGIDTKLVTMLNGAQPAVQVALIQAIGQRHVTTAALRLLQAAQSPQPEVSDAAVRVLQDLGGPAQVPGLLDRMLAVPEGARDTLMATLAAIARRSPDEATRTGSMVSHLDKVSTGADQADLLTLLGMVGGPTALDRLSKAAFNGPSDVRLAALSQLAEWPTDEPLPDLLKAAGAAPDAKLRAIALRGYTAMIGQNEQRPPDETVALYRQAAVLATTPDQKRTILSGLAKVPSPAALVEASGYLTDAALRPEAELAVVAIANNISGADPEGARKALEPIAASSALPDTRTHARAALDQIEKRSQFVTAWQVSPAYERAGTTWDQLFNIPFAPEMPGHEKEVAWRPMPLSADPTQPWLLDLLALWGGEQKVAYLRTAVWADIARDLVLELGSDDGVKAWWNGKVVVADNAQRAVAPAQDKVKVRAEKGWNPLILKITQNNQGWAACARFTNADGSPAAGLRYQAAPPPAGLQFVLASEVSVPTPVITPAATAPVAPTITLPDRPSEVHWFKVVINANSDFEGACAADINGDGKLDIVSGDTWYEAPHWTPHKFRDVGDWGRGPNESGYRRDFADLPMDVNGDGKVDIVTCDYASGEISWCENTGAKTPWPTHLIAKPGSMETMVFAPFLGPGTQGILPNCGGKVVWYELRKAGPEPQWVEHVVGTEGAGHGVGWGDVNGDGKVDIVTPRGWYEQVDAKNDKWIWHGDWNCNPGSVSIGMPVLDVDGDGRNDIVWGNGHGYGMFWLQQMPPGSAQKWTQHTIDNSWGQAHALMLADLLGNGKPVVLTGKRYKAHDTDPSVADPLGLYYYRYDPRAAQWEKHVIDQGTHTGTGLQLTAVDLRHTGLLDIIAPGKSGLYLFENGGTETR